MTAMMGDWFGPYVSPGLYAAADGRILVASCLRCNEMWRAPGEDGLDHIPAAGVETLYEFAARHDRSAHG